MLLLLSILLSKSFAAQCTAETDGPGGSCKICDPNTNLCQTCNYDDQYEPNQDGGCSLRTPSKCSEISKGAAGTCEKCNSTSDLCQTCNYPDDYEPNEYGNCSLKPKPQCTVLADGPGGSCSVCDTNTNLCQSCNYPHLYEPNKYGNCSERATPLKCIAFPNGQAGSCERCNLELDLCEACNYPDKYEPNELGNCSLKQTPTPAPKRCNPEPRGAGGSCEKCNEELDLCAACNYPDKYEPNELGNCSLKPTPVATPILKRCNPEAKGAEGSCERCNESDLCAVCNHPDKYEPNEFGNCSLKPPTRCNPVSSPVAGTCSVCNTTSDLCQTCNLPNQYEPNEYGNCSIIKPKCTPVQYGEGGSCSVCNETTNLCQECNYPTKYEPDQFGTCARVDKCVNITDGAAGTCSICTPNNRTCFACNYPEIFEPDEHGGCVIKQQSQCTEEFYGPPGSCAVCNERTHQCQVCNYPDRYKPTSFGNCSHKSYNGCSDSVTNCLRCDPRNPDVCVECQYRYGLRGGYCTKCPAHLYDDSKHPCYPDCSIIPNCHVGREYDDDDCALENGQIYCLKCSKGYHPSDDYKSCIQDTPGPCAYKVPGCLECAYNGSSKCTKCDQEKNFILDREDGECKCKKGFMYVFGECLLKDEVKVDCSDHLHKCDKCAFNSTTCVKCDDDYGLENGQCVKCEKGAHVSGSLPCLPRCTAIEHCNYCSEDGKECFKCENGYDESDDHSKCVSEGKGDCDPSVIGCKKCSKSDPTYCLKCDEKGHFDESDVFPGTCVCDEDYDFVNNQCVIPYYPAIPPPPPQEQFQINATVFNLYVFFTGTIYTILQNATFVPGTMYILLVPITITEVIIPRGPTHFQLTIPKHDEKGVKVDADPTTQVDFSCPNGARIHILKNDNNYNIKGNGIISLLPPLGSNVVIVKKITMDQSNNDMQLNSIDADITVKEVEIYGHQTIHGQSLFYHTTLEITKIQSGSSLTPENISITTLQIAIQSILYIRGNSHVDISDYQVYYNSSSTKIPIQFTSPFPDFSRSKLHIYNMNQGSTLQEGESFNVASFSGENSREACESFKLEESDFRSSECQTFGDVTYKVAKQAEASNNEGNKKKGLSGGAIAGIVVGCVVAVGLVVFLCVWFLVVKKNRPAHKRSGEPANSREKLEI